MIFCPGGFAGQPGEGFAVGEYLGPSDNAQIYTAPFRFRG
jgi:hypothetical protein